MTTWSYAESLIIKDVIKSSHIHVGGVDMGGQGRADRGECLENNISKLVHTFAPHLIAKNKKIGINHLIKHITTDLHLMHPVTKKHLVIEAKSYLEITMLKRCLWEAAQFKKLGYRMIIVVEESACAKSFPIHEYSNSSQDIDRVFVLCPFQHRRNSYVDKPPFVQKNIEKFIEYIQRFE